MLSDADGPLLEALSVGRTDIVKKLLEEVRAELNRASPDDPDKQEREFRAFLDAPRAGEDTLLHLAVKADQCDIARALLYCGADPSLPSSSADGQVPILALASSKDMHQVFVASAVAAIVSSNEELVGRLLLGGLSPNFVDGTTKGLTLLHWACTCGKVDLAALLLSCGADASVQDADGITPLHEAVRRKNDALATELVKAGADINIVAHAGELKGSSPLDMIRTSSHNWSSAFLSILPIGNGYEALDGDINDNEDKTTEIEKVKSDLAPTPPRSRLESLDGRSSPVNPVITDERLNLLWPQPSSVQQLAGEPILIPEKMPLSVSPGKESVHKILDVFDRHRNRFRVLRRHIYLNESLPVVAPASGDDNAKSVIFCSLSNKDSGLFPVRGSYRLHVSTKGQVTVGAGDLEGLNYALLTLMQMFAMFGDEGLVPVMIEDGPQCGVRAALWDMNPYGRVPKYDLMIQMVEGLASLKLNQLHAFVRMEPDGKWGFSISKSELLSLDRFCHEHFIQFVPAFDVPSSVTLNDLLQMVPQFHEVISCFDQCSTAHIGPKLATLLFDSHDCRFQSLNQQLFPHCDTLFVCANGFTDLDRLDLPLNVVLLHYGFQTPTGFCSSLSKYQKLGRPLGVCTGTLAWSNLAGAPDSMIASHFSASRAVRRFGGACIGGSGVSIVAHWSSDPAMTHAVFAWPGFLVAAGLAWNEDTPRSFLEGALPDLLDLHVIGDVRFPWGQTILELGRAEQAIEAAADLAKKRTTAREASLLLRVLVDGDNVSLENVSIDNDIAAATSAIKRAQTNLFRPTAQSEASAAVRHATRTNSAASLPPILESVRHELQLSSDLLLVATRLVRAMTGTSVTSIDKLTPTFRTDMANRLLGLTEQLKALWLSRYHEGGLAVSTRGLSNLLGRLVPDGKNLLL